MTGTTIAPTAGTRTGGLNTRRPAPVSTATLPVLIDAIADPRSSAASVAEVVASDHGLASRVLGLANSAQFGLSRTVSRLDMAVGLVGTAMVQTLAIASAAALLDRSGRAATTRVHAMEVAAAARILAPRVDARPSDAFAAGLLHDVGELLLLQSHPSEYGALHECFDDHADQLRVEKERFGLDHALLGAEHLLDWRVPDVIAEAVADHHEPYDDSSPTTVAVAAADALCSDDGRTAALGCLGIDADEAATLRDLIVEERTGLEAVLVA